jgi:Cohesin domain
VLSLPTALQALPGGTVVVPVNIDTAKPDASTGATEAILALRYDPQVFTVSSTDVQLGSLTGGWQLTAEINAQTGEIGIDLWSTSPIQTTAAGSLVTIAMHVRDTAPVGSTDLTLVNQVNPTGQRVFTTTVSDGQGAFVLHAAVTATGIEPGVPGLVTVISGLWTVGSEQWGEASGQAAVVNTSAGADNKALDMQLTAHSSLPTAYYLEQAFSDIDPMLAQETMVAQPGAILNTDLNEQTSLSGPDKALLQPLADTQHDWVSAELLEHLGQAGRNQLGTLDDADLAALEAFFAKNGISAFGA